METTVITRREDLKPRGEGIRDLFLRSYGSPLNREVWTWAYLDNPHGDAVVALCEDGGVLVGHYAIIPLPVRGAGRALNSWLSMTTMVAPTHRGQGLFVLLARAAYEAAAARGADCVFGFPNRQSEPGFRKHLGWRMAAPDHLATFPKADLVAFAGQQPVFPRGRLGLDLSSEATRRWRLAKPGTDYRTAEGLVYKEYGGTLDVVYCEEPCHLAALPGDRDLNVLVPGDCPLPAGTRAVEYLFGGAPLAGEFDPAAIRRCMLLSDVF